jgi:phosphatidylinositol kinase/protein kinase (PI-3  family)
VQVLRDNKSAVVTVLEVLLHDPLYNWSVGPGKAAARQEAGQCT